MAEKGRLERCKITYDDILATTGISKSTLTRLANDRAGRVYISTTDRLCAYFNCQPGDLFLYVEEE
jgi:putative transcriptional regulator